ncbi:DUF1684 domain-containing protein [Cryptosporangium aurantiacum]|uniref:DUF1684 domain-containing protein n=1 Tax=Cryptosporangium aurantiacum TaxID=134849 RepID=A0A1M7K3M4_9ACTN|nr:DUF1684 domain-containing protein [Cryptosporangium aurantiacum]SHM59858.1 hypothetical protein SAMN05443668_101993 [Cryptosporangium aurantiacum]
MSAPTSASVSSAAAEWTAWRTSRLASVTAPTGNLALVETRWSAPDEPEPVVELADGVTVTRLQRRNLTTGAVEHGIRHWDANSPAIQHFETIDVFPYNPDLVLKATLRSDGEPKRVPFEHLRDNGRTRDLAVPGDILLTRAGVDYTLNAFDDDGTLLLVFGDETNGVDTYAAGRFLFVERQPGADRVVLDFNRAFVPPCGFSAEYNCPMPPRQNRLAGRIEAGEKLPVFRGGFAPS